MAFAGAAGVVRFGAFEFDTISRVLRKGNTRIRVPDQSLAILAVLLERPGELVPRAEIQARLWPNGTDVEFEQNVNSAVRRLRTALSDSGAAPRFVETVPRRGFRFLGKLDPPAADDGADPIAGTTVSHYRILAPIGRGAMGVVYRAEDLTLGRAAALKFLPAELASHRPSLDRMRREARMIGALNHPCICTLYELGEAAGRVFLAMEYLEGESLRQRLLRGRVAENEFSRIAQQVASGLAAAHANNIVHRDIKPENIFLLDDGRVKILDFGLAKWTLPPPADSAGASHPGMVMGTIAYMPPEQIRGEAVDGRSDIFSFGCVLYEMLSGRCPCFGATANATMHAIPGEEPPAIPAARPELACIVRRCLNRDPCARFQSVEDLASGLRSALTGPPSGAVAREVSPRRWRKAALGLTLIAALLVVIAIATRWITPAERPSKVSERLTIELPADAPLAPAGLVSPTSDCPALAITPDGSVLAYVAQMSGGTRICLRDMATGKVRPLEGTDGGHTPFFSPDGTALGFFAQSKLKRVSVSGDVPRILADAPNPWGAVWGADGFIYYNRFEGEGIVRTEAEGGPVTIVTTGQQYMPELVNGGPALLVAGSPGTCLIEPGGRVQTVADGFGARYLRSGHVLYATHGALMAAPFQPGRAERAGSAIMLADDLRTANFGVALFAVAQDGTVIYAPGKPQQMTSFVWVERDGRRHPAGLPEAMHHVFDLSPDGRYLAYTSADAMHLMEWTIWIRDLQAKTEFRLTPRVPAGRSSLNRYPRWTPDGRHLVYLRDADGKTQLMWARVDGSSEPEVLWTGGGSGPAWLYPMSFAPDGSTVMVFGRSADSSFDIYVVPLDETGRPVLARMRLHRGDRFGEAFGQISPDGRWMLYSSDASGRYEVYVTSYPKPGAVHQVTRSGGTEPMWNPSAPEIVYMQQSGIYSVKVTLSPEFRSEEPRLLFRGPFPDIPGFSFDLTSDGRRFLMLENPRVLESTRTLNVITNVMDELRRRIPAGGTRP